MTNKEAIEFIKTDISRLWDTPQNREHKEALEKAIKALEQEPKTKWIPVSERLPQPDVEVLVTDDAGGLATISTDSIYKSESTDEKEWYTSQNVTAWMPLPKPYKEEGD